MTVFTIPRKLMVLSLHSGDKELFIKTAYVLDVIFGLNHSSFFFVLFFLFLSFFSFCNSDHKCTIVCPFLRSFFRPSFILFGSVLFWPAFCPACPSIPLCRVIINLFSRIIPLQLTLTVQLMTLAVSLPVFVLVSPLLHSAITSCCSSPLSGQFTLSFKPLHPDKW